MTEIQMLTYRFIREFIRSKSYSPTGKEIANELGISTTRVHQVLIQLHERGYIDKRRGWRNIALLELGRVRKARARAA